MIYTACALINFDRHLRHFNNNLATALDGQTLGEPSYLIIKALLPGTEPGGIMS